MTKEQVQNTIDYFAGKTLSLRCEIVPDSLGINYKKEDILKRYKKEGCRFYILMYEEDSGEVSGIVGSDADLIPYDSAGATVLVVKPETKDSSARKEIIEINFESINEWNENIEILGHPVMLTDVLAKMDEKDLYSDVGVFKDGIFDEQYGDKDLPFTLIDTICSLWGECESNKSLQQIVEESGWEERERLVEVDPDGSGGVITENYEQLKSPKARALFKFLKQIKNDR